MLGLMSTSIFLMTRIIQFIVSPKDSATTMVMKAGKVGVRVHRVLRLILKCRKQALINLLYLPKVVRENGPKDLRLFHAMLQLSRAAEFQGISSFCLS